MSSAAAALDEAAYPPNNWGVKALILAGGPAVGLALAGVAVVLPKIQAALAHGPEDEFLVKMLSGAVGAAMLVGAPLTGWLSDRIGLRRVLILTYTLFTLAGGAGMFLDNLGIFVVTRFLLGIAGAAAVTASIIIVNRRLVPAERAKWMGFYIAAAYVGNFLLHPLAGFLAELNWHYAFSVYLSGAPFILIALVSFKDGPRRTAAARQMATREQPPFPSWFPFPFALLSLFMGFIVYLVAVYVPFQLATMGIGPGGAALIALAAAVTGMPLSLIFGRARHVLSDDAAFIWCFATTAVGGVIMGFATNWIMVTVGMGFYGLGVGWFMPNLMFVLGRRVSREQQGTAAGFVKGANYVSMPVSIMALEGLSRSYGPWLPVLMSGVIALVLLVIYVARVIGRGEGWREPAAVALETAS